MTSRLNDAAIFQRRFACHWESHARWPVAQIHSLKSHRRWPVLQIHALENSLQGDYYAKSDFPDQRAIPQDDVEVRFTTKSGPMSGAERRKLYEAAYSANFCKSSAINYSEAALHKTIRGSVSLLIYPCPDIEDDWRRDNLGKPASWLSYSREAPLADEESDPDTEYLFNTSAGDRAVWKEYEEDERSAAAWDAYVPPPFDPYAITPIRARDGLDFLFWEGQITEPILRWRDRK
jgi:hypothetical protein